MANHAANKNIPLVFGGTLVFYEFNEDVPLK